MALAALLLIIVLAIAGCAALVGAARTSSALQGAGYQNASVNVATGTGMPAGGVVNVSYSSGPSGNDPQDAQGAEQIVWDKYSATFGAVQIFKVSGGCVGPACVSHSDEITSATYAQLAAMFGPRPQGLDNSSAFSVPGWVIGVIAGAIFAFLVVLTLVIILLVRRNARRKRNRPPRQPYGPPTMWPGSTPPPGTWPGPPSGTWPAPPPGTSPSPPASEPAATPDQTP